MKKLVVFCFILITPLITYAQNEPDWKLINQKGSVKVFVKYTICDQQPIVYLKTQNSSGKQVTLTWKERFSMQDRNVEVNSGKTKSLSLAARATVAGNCGENQNASLIINPNNYVSMAGPGFWELELFDLKVQ